MEAKKWQLHLETMVQTNDDFNYEDYYKACDQKWTIISGPDYLKKRQGGFEFVLNRFASPHQQIVYLVHQQSDYEHFSNWFNTQTDYQNRIQIKNQKIVYQKPLPLATRRKKWPNHFQHKQTLKPQSVLGYVVALDQIDQIPAIDWTKVAYVWFENPRFLNEQLWINFYHLLRPFFNKKCHFDQDQVCQIHFSNQCQPLNYQLVMIANDEQFDQNDLVSAIDHFINQPVANEVDQSFINQIINYWQTITIIKINHSQQPQSIYLKDFYEEFIDQSKP